MCLTRSPSVSSARATPRTPSQRRSSPAFIAADVEVANLPDCDRYEPPAAISSVAASWDVLTYSWYQPDGSIGFCGGSVGDLVLGIPRLLHRCSLPSSRGLAKRPTLLFRRREIGGQRLRTDTKVLWTLVGWVAHTAPGELHPFGAGHELIAGASAPTLGQQFGQLDVRTWPNPLKQVAFRCELTNLRDASQRSRREFRYSRNRTSVRRSSELATNRRPLGKHHPRSFGGRDQTRTAALHNYKTLVSSDSKGNPFPVDETFSMDVGTYCETVIKTREPLLVANALQDGQWKSAPDVQLGMISYLGFPVSWPDGRMFGTICVVDDKANRYSDLYQQLLLHCRDVLQGTCRRWSA